MSLQDLIANADTETFETGAYSRAVRTRKWIFLFSAVIVVLAHSWFNHGDVSSWLGIASIPVDVIRRGATSVLAYFLLQYGLTLIQLSAVYVDLLDERFGSWSKAKLNELTGQLKAVNKEQDEEEKAHQAWLVESGVRRTIAARDNDLKEADREDEMQRARARVLQTSNEVRTRERDRIQAEIERVMRSDVRAKARVVVSEVIIDALRILPPALVGLISLMAFGLPPFSLS